MRAKPWTAAMLGVLIVVLGSSACGTSTKSTTDAPAETRTPTVAPFENADVAIALKGVLGVGHAQALVQDEGWGEFVLSISNRGSGTLTVRDVKLLNTNGRYQKSASSYGEIMAPPEFGAEVAGEVAKTGSGLVLGSFVPFGGVLSGVLWGAASASSAEGRATAQRAFNERVLKAVELAPNGKMTGSAFLPNISNAAALVVDYAADGRSGRIELPFTDPAQP
ncbi:MAG: hypothetical protein OEM98_14785 [Gammaproteobacteria bacterium]|nr:hypothetical protein [Gammaproteobacteria bacterium]